MLRVVDIEDDYDRALASGFMASEETNRRADEDRRYFREQVGRQRGADYIQRFNDFSRSLDLNTLAQRAISVGRGINNAFKGDMIYEARSIGDFQHISETMQNFMLANPVINYLARNQRMSAWGRDRDSYAYHDDDPNTNPYYVEMMDGWMDDEGEIIQYLTDDDDSVAPRLTHVQKMAIHQNVEQLRTFLSVGSGSDPTSRENDNM